MLSVMTEQPKRGKTMSKNDDSIKALLKKVEEQMFDLGAKPKSVLITNGVWGRLGEKTTVNINTVSDKEVIIEIMSELLKSSYFKNMACEKLGMSPYANKFYGFSQKDWETDLKFRLSVIAWNEKSEKLSETKAKLNNLMSEDVKTELELAKILKSLE